MKKVFFSIGVSFFVFTINVFSQVKEIDKLKVKEVYENADMLFLSKKYTESLEYLKRDGGTYLKASDSLQYLVIKNLEILYRTDFTLTKELESYLKLFFSKGNRYTFPELKYSEVSAIYSAFQGFKESDKVFYDSVSRVTNLEKVETLPGINTVVANYLKKNSNTYYSKELNSINTNINNKLAQVALMKKKRDQDSIYRRRVKYIGKKMSMNLSYLVSSGDNLSFKSINNYSEAVNFFNGKSAGGVGQKFVLNASIGGIMINLFAGTRAKVALDWNLFDGEYAVLDWASNSMLKSAETGGSDIKEMISIKAGTRIGPLISVLLSKNIAAGIYYNARPGIQFLLKPIYFSWITGTVPKTYEVSRVIPTYNLSNEVGIKFFFWGRISINPYLHFGAYNWKNDIKTKGIVGDSTTLSVQANYKFNNIGIRIGF